MSPTTERELLDAFARAGRPVSRGLFAAVVRALDDLAARERQIQHVRRVIREGYWTERDRVVTRFSKAEVDYLNGPGRCEARGLGETE